MRFSLVMLLLISSTCCLMGQNTAPSIAITSSADLTKAPEVIRLVIKVYGKGKDMDIAKEGLVVAEKKLLTKLGESGAEVIVAHAGFSTSSQTLQQRFSNIANMLNNYRMNVNGGMPLERDKANPSFMERVLSIDMRPKLKGKEAQSLLSDLTELTRKNYQDWTGIAEAFKDDIKQLEEMNKQNNPNFGRMDLSYIRNDMNYYQQDVRFQMAAKVTREDRLKLYQEALRRARSMAGDLAEAAEMKLGTLNSISTNYAYTTYQSQNYFPGRSGQVGETGKFPITLKEDGSESLAIRDVNAYQNANIEPIVFQITLNTSFKLEPK